MTRLFSALVLLLSLAVPVRAQVTPTYLGHYDVQPYGNDTTYMRALTHRYVGGELRFLSLTHRGHLLEFRLPASFGQSASGQIRSWDLNPTDALNNFSGIWFEAAKNRLWVTSAEDYTSVNHPAKVTLIQLNDNGSATRLKTFNLNVPAKRVYGGCHAVPAALVSQLGGPYVCGWGGYTSLVAQGGGASIGPTMYAIPDPDGIANGATVSARTILDTASSRGVRKSIPVNYFDGGDPRQNPPSRPTAPPLASAQWLSPNAQGLGWMVWGDSYYNTGVWVGTTFVSIASLCQGSCWYQSSTLAFDGRQFEMHQWAGSSLGSDPLRRPTQMDVLNLPRGNTQVWGGNSSAGNIAGATYDETTGRLYLIGYPLGPNVYTGRVYAFQMAEGSGPVEPPPPPVDEVPPTVSVTAPENGAVLTGMSLLSVEYADNVGVSTIDLLLDGAVVLSLSAGPSPLTLPNDTTQTPDGTYTFTARATDAAGNATLSEPVTVTVRNTEPAPEPVNAVVSDWSEWSGPAWPACTSSPQTRTETRTRTVVTPAQNGGSTPPLSETREVSRTCDVPAPEPEPVTHEDLADLLRQILAAITPPPAPEAVDCTVTSTTSDTVTIRRSTCGIARPANGSTLRVLRGE